MVAYPGQKPVAFKKVKRVGNEVHLDTGRMVVISRDHTKDFFASNLEVRWKQNGLLQYWRPGDRDHLNLGGTVSSLDGLDRDADLGDAHVADDLSPDAKALQQPALTSQDDDPAYYAAVGKLELLRNTFDKDMHFARKHRPRQVLARTHNQILDQYRYSPGVLSRAGYFLLNDSSSPVMDADDFPVERNRPDARDWYFFCYGSDYKQGLGDWVMLTGRAPLPSRGVFGLIYSRWPTGNEEHSIALVEEFERQGIPMSVLVLDMDWHKHGWCNWDWDPGMYPDPKRFFRWCHKRGVQVTLNVHPARVREDDSHFETYVRAAGTADKIDSGTYGGKTSRKVDVNIGNKREAGAFMRVCNGDVARSGMDFWWVDGSNGSINGAHAQLVTNKLFFESTETPRRRSMLLSRYGGVGSHRYGALFTGDTQSQWEVLAMQCEYNIRAGHLGLAYVSHDIGGFSNRPSATRIEPRRYVRWSQFGVFNPVFRYHSGPHGGTRIPWEYGRPHCDIVKKWLRIRHSLLPYIYTAARVHYDTGVPLVRGLFVEHPDDDRAYRFDEFYFGDSLLVAPMLDPGDIRAVYLPEGAWYEFLSGRAVRGGREFKRTASLDDVPVYVRAGSIIPRQGPDVPAAAAHVSGLALDVYPDADGSFELYEDDGRSQAYKRKGFCRTRFTLRDDGREIAIVCRRIEGKPLGKTRTVSVSVALSRRPKELALNGKPLDPKTGHYSRASRRFTLSLGELPSTRRFRLTVAR